MGHRHRPAGRLRRSVTAAVAAFAVLVAGVSALVWRTAPARDEAGGPAAPATTAAGPIPDRVAPSTTTRATEEDQDRNSVPPPARDRSVYEGLGAWVDVYDYAPAYRRPNDTQLSVAAAVDLMAARGVKTLFLQATRLDPRSPEGIVDRGLVGEFLQRSRSKGIRVVGWYLPKFADVDVDLRNLLLIRDFEFEGHRFDGIGVDIEWRADVASSAVRNQRMIELSRRLRAEVGSDALGAIVLPPVLLEVVNPRYWPDFAWEELADLYDVWLPMTYWTFRSTPSGYRDGYRYTEETIRRLRANLSDPSAAVHPIGGIADAASPEDYRGFMRAATEANALGVSMYDLETTHDGGWTALQRR